jgi:hypothetical protein
VAGADGPVKLSYSQSTGILSGLPGEQFAIGYSGIGPDRNNPEAQSHHGAGPIPRGRWLIGSPEESPRVGPMAIPLLPSADCDTCGRGSFYIHGDAKEHPGAASHGCIVMSRAVREAIVNGGFDELEVTE